VKRIRFSEHNSIQQTHKLNENLRRFSPSLCLSVCLLLFKELQVALETVGSALAFLVLLSCDALLTMRTFEMIHMKTKRFLSCISRHCDCLSSNNRLSASRTEKSFTIEMITIHQNQRMFIPKIGD
jgi:hypothetical protein